MKDRGRQTTAKMTGFARVARRWRQRAFIVGLLLAGFAPATAVTGNSAVISNLTKLSPNLLALRGLEQDVQLFLPRETFNDVKKEVHQFVHGPTDISMGYVTVTGTVASRFGDCHPQTDAETSPAIKKEKAFTLGSANITMGYSLTAKPSIAPENSRRDVACETFADTTKPLFDWDWDERDPSVGLTLVREPVRGFGASGSGSNGGGSSSGPKSSVPGGSGGAGGGGGSGGGGGNGGGDPSPVPLPAGLPLMVLALGGLAAMRRKFT